MHYARGKKPDSKGYIVNDSFGIDSRKGQSTVTESGGVGTRGRKRVGNEGSGDTCVGMEHLLILTVVAVVKIYRSIRTL